MLIENLDVAVQSSDEVKIRDFTLTPKSSSETPAISEGLELSLVISARLKAMFEVGLYLLLARMFV